MTDAALTTSITAVCGVALAWINLLTLKQSKANSQKADVAAVKQDIAAINQVTAVEKTTEIHDMVDGNLSKVRDELAESRKHVTELIEALKAKGIETP